MRERTKEKPIQADITTGEESNELSGARPGEQETGKNPTDTMTIRTEGCTGTALRLVERATALRGQNIAHPQEPKSVRRLRTRMDIFEKDAEIPYVKFEAVIRDLICSLMERQDRMNEEIFYKINDLSYRIEDLEQARQEDGGGQ
jgi:hypothetical protein